MRVIDADTLAVLNGIIDYLLLLCAGKLCALPLRRGRMALGAAWGGAYAVLAELWPGLLGLWTAKLAAGAGIVLLAFGARRRTLRALVAFYAAAAAFGGAVYALVSLRGESPERGIPVSGPVLLLSFALCYGAVELAFRHIGRRAERKTYAVTLDYRGRSADFTALADSGNELVDPLTGCGVLIAGAEALAPLFDAPELLLRDAAAALEALDARGEAAGLRLLPCACVAAEQTLLLCFRPDSLTVDGVRRRDLLVAVSPRTLAADGAYQAIV